LSGDPLVRKNGEPTVYKKMFDVWLMSFKLVWSLWWIDINLELVFFLFMLTSFLRLISNKMLIWSIIKWHPAELVINLIATWILGTLSWSIVHLL
jgi:hypothetical protein